MVRIFMQHFPAPEGCVPSRVVFRDLFSFAA